MFLHDHYDLAVEQSVFGVVVVLVILIAVELHWFLSAANTENLSKANIIIFDHIYRYTYKAYANIIFTISVYSDSFVITINHKVKHVIGYILG